MIKDVTDNTEFGSNDDEFLPIYKCICGRKFRPWEFILQADSESLQECPECGGKFYFKNTIQIFEFIED